ncbi:MAG: DUF3179 domain-containing protein [Planctomycetaceae bacterium]|nr:DUF3179 domain-containing protein [Planctomycetaceae bacterium]
MDQPSETNQTKLIENHSSAVPVKRTVATYFLRWGVILTLCAASAFGLTHLLDSNNQTEFNSTTIQAQQPSSPFELQNLTVPRKEVHGGGPPKDGIPAISKPQFISATQATYLKPEDRVIGVHLENISRAYPIAILNYHEIINDKIGKLPIAVSYCPLCDSAVVFDRRLKNGEREFGVSGLLFNSNVLMYDRKGKPESLRSQMMTQAVSGESVNEHLKTLPLELTTWKSWKTRHPKTEVLSNQTGHHRDYSRSPYAGYFQSPKLMFPVDKTDKRLPAKSPVLGIWTSKSSRAYSLASFTEDQTNLKQTIDGIPFTLHYEKESNSLRISQAGPGIQTVYSLWLAWYAFHTDTEIYSQ